MTCDFTIDYNYYTDQLQCNQQFNIKRINEASFLVNYKKKILKYDTNTNILLNNLEFTIKKLINVFTFIKSKLNKNTTMDFIDDFNISFVIYDGVNSQIIFNKSFEYNYIINTFKYELLYNTTTSKNNVHKISKIHKFIYAFQFIEKETRSLLFLFNNINYDRDINLIKKNILSQTTNVLTRKLPRELVENILDYI